MITTPPPPSFSQCELDALHPDQLTHVQFTEFQERMYDDEAWEAAFAERKDLTRYAFCELYLYLRHLG